MSCKIFLAITVKAEVQQSTNSMGWSTVTFDFSQAKISGTNTTVNATGGYSTVPFITYLPILSLI